MERIAFGNETKLQIIASTCPGCGVSHGSLHVYGCPVESCPKCGGRLIECTCKALDLIDAIETAKAIAKTITDRAEVHRAIDKGSRHLNRTYYEEGVMLWIVDDVCARDPKATDMLLDSAGFRQVGIGYAITAEDAAQHLGVSVEKAREVLSEMQAESCFPGWEKHDGDVH
jgi:hypothetical protein